MKIKPLGPYPNQAHPVTHVTTFYIPKNLNKFQIKKLIGDAFGVTVTNVRTMNKRALVRKNHLGKIITKPSKKKCIVALKDKEKIDLFDVKK